MLVDVVQLRYLGEKLPGDRVRAAKPLRGRLTLHSIRPGTHWWERKQVPLLAGLMSTDTDYFLIPPLDYARVTRIRANGMVIVGFQQAPNANGRQSPVYKQAWWVRPVTAVSPEMAASGASAVAPAQGEDRDRTAPPPADG